MKERSKIGNYTRSATGRIRSLSRRRIDLGAETNKQFIIQYPAGSYSAGNTDLSKFLRQSCFQFRGVNFSTMLLNLSRVQKL